MKTILSKILITTIISPALVLLTVSPVLAVDNSDITPPECLRVITLRTTGREGFATNLAKMNTGSSDRMKKIAASKSNVDKQLTTARENAKKKFEQEVAKLESTTGLTDSQKQAIETYKSDMENAKITREFAVDTARTEYQRAMASAVTEQQTALTAAVITYQTSFEKAFATVTTNCAKGTNMAAVKTAVQTAHKDLKTTISNLKTSDKIKQLTKTRDDAIKTARDDFAKQAAILTKTLKSALGDS
ncbi:MAG: hypothetical protein NTV39_00720 [Candidatus Saccharibacteria bacterium]|nr:hypothetical protein [Candidatus Saccharibacteria bacterium]